MAYFICLRPVGTNQESFLNDLHRCLFVLSLVGNIVVGSLSSVIMAKFICLISDSVLQHHCRCCGRTLCHEHSSNQMVCSIGFLF